jgi:hypothetical protein
MLKINIKFLIFMVSAYIFAYLQGGNLPYAVFYGFIITFLLGLYCILKYRKKVFVDLRFQQKVYNAGDKDVMSMVVYNESFIAMPYIWVKNKMIQNFKKEYMGDLFNLKSEESKVLKQEITFKKRGIYKFGDISINLKDLFCVFESNKSFNKNYDVKVYPKILDIEKSILKGGDIFKSVFSNNKSIEDAHSTKDMRKYRDGDSLKRINWKVSAKYNELYVREFERVSGREFNIFLDMNKSINDFDNEGELEESLVDIAMSLINYTMSKEIKSSMFINAARTEIFQIESKFDFEKVMDYFLTQFSDGYLDFAKFLSGNINKVSSLGGIGIITGSLEDDLTKILMEIKDSGYIVMVFYLPGQETEMKNINLLNKVGVECISISDFINNTVSSEIG